MPVLRYLSHPEAAIDPAMPAADLGLRARGRARMRLVASLGWPAGTTRIIASSERRAQETAAFLAVPLGLTVEVAADLAEIDCGGAGHMPHDRRELLVSKLFARPEESIEGWERAVDAQARAAAALWRLLAPQGHAQGHSAPQQAGDLLIVGHGCVGTLLWCHLAGRPIDRAEDQPNSGGQVWAVTLPDLVPVHRWRAMETAAGL